MKTKYLSYSGAVSRLIPSFIILASLLVLPKVQAASASAADLLMDFQFNEGEVLTSRSSIEDVTLSLAAEVDPAWSPTGVLEAPSGLPNDRAALFDGQGWLYGEYDEEPIDLTQPLTWESWIYVDKDSTKTVQDYFNLSETLKVGVTSEHNFVFTFRTVDDVISDIVIEADEISDSYWTHLACSWDPAGGNTPGMGIVRFYQDGILKQEVYTVSQFRDYQANILSIGASNSGKSLFQGKMDRVRLHKALLTAAQLDSDAANPKPITSNTVIAYEFNEETVPFLSATSPALPLESGTEKLVVADTFTLTGLKYTVLTEEPGSQTGTVSVEAASKEISGDIVISTSVSNGGINYSVTLIPEGAFSWCTKLTSVDIPESVTLIDYSAFNGCSSLKNAIVGNSVTSIGNFAFYGCTSLTNVTIGGSVTSIGNQAFQGCSGLTSVTIPDSVASIGNGIFYGCSSLRSIIIPDSVTSIGYGAFGWCSKLTDVTIGSNVTVIGSDTFAFSGLTSIIIPDSVTSLGRAAFYDCNSLTNATIGNSVAVIRDSTFSSCNNLKSVIIGNSVTSIERAAFYECNSLTNIIIPNSVNVIGNDIFSFSGLTSIEIPDSVTSLGNAVFYDCNSLTNATIGNSVAVIGDSTFSTCNNLKSVIIGNSVTSIERAAFYESTSLTNVTIGNSVTAIGRDAFAFSGLKSIIIPESVTSIGGYAFNGCSSLTGVYFRGNAPALLDGYAFFDPAIIYYKARTSGWGDYWYRRPTAVWTEAPKITEQPQSQAVMAGDPVTFSVTAMGIEPLSYQWYKNDVPINGATDTFYTIGSVKGIDVGTYKVVVTNRDGIATSTATLTLTQPYRATGTVQIVNGYVVGVNVADGGWGYTRPPNIRIIDETGTGATGHCVIENGVITQIIVDSTGSDYSGEVTILIGSPFSSSSLEIAVSEVKVKMHLVLGMKYQLWSSVDCINWEQVGESFTAEKEEMDLWFKVEVYGRFFKLQEI